MQVVVGAITRGGGGGGAGEHRGEILAVTGGVVVLSRGSRYGIRAVVKVRGVAAWRRQGIVSNQPCQ